VVLNEGRVLFSGSRRDFQSQESRMLHVRVKQGREKMAAGLRSAGFEVVSREGTAHLEVALGEGQSADAVWKVARDLDLQIRHLAPATVSLEQAFEKAVDAGDAP
jgi:ABC-type uncharacterized transport system ATPase subunit